MDRLTHRDGEGRAVLDAGLQEAAERLALFEDVCESVAAECLCLPGRFVPLPRRNL